MNQLQYLSRQDKLASDNETMAPLRPRQSAFFAAVIILFLIDTLIFRSGLYQGYIEPYSSVGMYWFRRNLAASKIRESNNLVALVGDSRIQEAFSSKIFDDLAQFRHYKAVNLAIPGTSLRVWYYLLKQVDPKRNAFRLIVIPMASYSDTDESENYNERMYDVCFLSPFLSIPDSLDCLGTFSCTAVRANLLMGTILKAYALRLDVRDFLAHPLRRLRTVSDFKKQGELNVYFYAGVRRSLDGLKLIGGKWTRGTSKVDDAAIDRLNHRVFDLPPAQAGLQRRYNSYWLNRLVEAYAQSSTKLVLVKIPTDGIPRHVTVAKDNSTIDSLGRKNKFIVLPENLCSNLERPQYFGDDLHLNYLGREHFTKKLAPFLIGLL